MRRLLQTVLLFTIASGLLYPYPTQAALVRETTIPDNTPSLGRSVRALGMGNAVLTMKGQKTSDMLYNPAALHDLPSPLQFSVMEFNAAINTGLVSVVKDVIDLGDNLSAAGGSTTDRITAFQTFVNEHIGEFQTVELGLPLFSVGRKDMGAIMLVDSRTTLSLRDRFSNRFDLRSRSDAAVALGGSYGLFFDDLVVAAMLKGIYRMEIDKQLTQGDLIRNSLGSVVGYDQWGKAMGLGADLAVRYRIPFLVELNPVIALVYQDVLDTRFFGSDTSDNQSNLMAGVGIHPKVGDFEFSLEVGARQIDRKRDLITKLQAGAEVRFPKVGPLSAAARVGMNQGYITTGASFDIKYATIDLAFYGEEKGFKTRQGANYKYVAGFGFHF